MKQAKKIFISAACLLLCSQSTGWAQNVYKDYVQDKYAQYSPFDHANRGLIYKKQTGHAGWFGNCDDDRQKMVSPYIDWHCRKPDSCLPVQFTKDLFADIFRKSDRFRDGAGGCICGNCKSNDCNGNCGAPIQGMVDATQKTPIAQPTDQRIASANVVGQSRTVHRTTSGHPAARTSMQQSNGGIYDRRGTNQRKHAQGDRMNVEVTGASSNRSYFTGAKQSERIQATESRSNDPRYSSDSSTVIPAAYQRAQMLNGQSQTSQPDSRFKLSDPRSGSAFPVPTQSKSTAVNSTPIPDRKVDPQHFQFRLIGGSANR